MHSFLYTDKMSYIYFKKNFETVNWLLMKERYNHCANSVAFKYFDNECPHNLNEAFIKALESSSSLRKSYQKPQQSFRKTSTGQDALSFIGLCIVE